MAAGADGWTQAPCFCPGPPPGSPSRWQRCRGYSVLHSQAWHAAASVPCLYSSVVLWQVVFPKNDPSLPPTHTHTHTHTPFVLTLLTLCTRWGLGRGLCPPPAAECDGLRAVTGQARTGRDGASRDSSRLGSPSWEPLGCLEAGCRRPSRGPHLGAMLLAPNLMEAAADPQGEQTPACPRRRL